MSHPLLQLLPGLPHEALGVVPSPLHEHPALATALGAASLLVKRDDRNGPEFGGNKLRALEFLLPEASPHPVTMGGYGSTWCAALAMVAARTGRQAHLALFPQPWTATVAGLLSTSLSHGDVHLAASYWSLPTALGRAALSARRAGPFHWLAAGGAEPCGVLGSMNAALELAQQVDQQQLNRPQAVVLPLGSGGTAAGLLLGFRLARWSIEVVGVRVADAWVANRFQVQWLVSRTERLLRRHGLRIPTGEARLRVVGDQLGPGYGHPTVAARESQSAFARADIQLDLTYSAKASAALHDSAARFPHLCFWHTFDNRLVASPLTEHPLLQRAQAHAESLWRQPKST